jgi:hypothetical protein
MAASVLAWRRNWAPSLPVTLAAAAAVRTAVVLLATSVTMEPDSGNYFHTAGEAVLHGHTPISAANEWNFLPFAPYLFAVEIKTGLSWEIAEKLFPVACDIATVWLIGLLSDDEHRDQVRFLYALSPVAILVSAWHGQIDPIAILLGLTAILLARRCRPGPAGAALGFAIATKTWPILFLPGILRATSRQDWPKTIGGAAAVLGGWALLPWLALGDTLRNIFENVAGVHALSLTGGWGWTALLRYHGFIGYGYSGPNTATVQTIGSALTLAGFVVVLVLFRRSTPEQLTVALLLVFLALTAGFGVQYLVWPVALLCLTRQPVDMLFMAVSGIYTGVIYLYGMFGPVSDFAQRWSILLALLALGVVPWRPGAERPDGYRSHLTIISERPHSG